MNRPRTRPAALRLAAAGMLAPLMIGTALAQGVPAPAGRTVPVPGAASPSRTAPAQGAPAAAAAGTPQPSAAIPPAPGAAPAAPGAPAPGTPAPGTPAPGTPAPGTPAPGTPAPGTPAQGPSGPLPDSATAATPRPAPIRTVRPAAAAATPLPIRAPALTLADAETMLLERNLAVVAARRGVDVARAQRLVADTSPPGTLGYSQTTAQVNERDRLSGFNGGRYVSPLNNASVNLTFTIERGGKRELRRRLADEQITVGEVQVLDALRAALFTLRTSFVQALQARANLQVALANRDSLNSTEGLLSRQVREGAIPESDLLRFQASRLPFEQDLAAAAQSYAAAAAQVAALLGADASRTASPAARSAGRDPVAAILAGVPYDLRGRFEDTRPLDLTRETLAEALPNRPDVLAASRGVNAADANARLVEAARSRDVSVSAAATRTELSQDLPNSSRPVRANDIFGIGVSIPIFTSRITEGNIAVANAQRGQAVAQAQGALAIAQADLATAWASYVQARSLLDLTTGAALRRAEEAFRSTEAAYQAGGRSLLDTLDALRTLNATRVAANAARAAYLTALAALEQATGVGGLAPRL